MENKTSIEKIIFVTVIMLLVILVFPLVKGLQFDFDFTRGLEDRFDPNHRFNRNFNNVFSFGFNDDFSPNHKIYFNNDSNNAFNFDDDFDYRLYFDNNFSQRFDFYDYFDDDFNLDEKSNPNKELQVSILKYGIYSNIRKRQTMSIKTQEQWTDLWRQMFPGQETPPYVDFEQSMLISVFMGEQPSGGYDISVTKVIETRDALKVYVEEVSPGVNCIVTLALTHPYQIVKLDYFNKPTIFEFNNKVKSCY